MKTYNVIFKKKQPTNTDGATTASASCSSVSDTIVGSHSSDTTLLSDNICCGETQAQQPLCDLVDVASEKKNDDISTTAENRPLADVGQQAGLKPFQPDDDNTNDDESVIKPPLERYKKHNKLSVTDLSSQIWCETQLNFVLSTGRKRQTQAMLSGIERHAVLEKEDHEIVDVEVETNEENLALRLLNSCILLDQLFLKKVVREVWVFGIVDGVLFRGVIDELQIKSAAANSSSSFCSSEPPFPHSYYTLISDTKTRREPREPSLAQKRTSAIQLQLYCYMVAELQKGNGDFELLFDIYKCDQDYTFTIPELAEYTNLRTLSQHFVSQLMKLPSVKHEMEIVYECDGTEFARNTIPYTETATLYAVRDLLLWWKGRRETEVVGCGEEWKCRFCDFLEDCPATPLQEPAKTQAIEKQKREEEERKLRREQQAAAAAADETNTSSAADTAATTTTTTPKPTEACTPTGQHGNNLLTTPSVGPALPQDEAALLLDDEIWSASVLPENGSTSANRYVQRPPPFTTPLISSAFSRGTFPSAFGSFATPLGSSRFPQFGHQPFGLRSFGHQAAAAGRSTTAVNSGEPLMSTAPSPQQVPSSSATRNRPKTSLSPRDEEGRRPAGKTETLQRENVQVTNETLQRGNVQVAKRRRKASSPTSSTVQKKKSTKEEVGQQTNNTANCNGRSLTGGSGREKKTAANRTGQSSSLLVRHHHRDIDMASSDDPDDRIMIGGPQSSVPLSSSLGANSWDIQNTLYGSMAWGGHFQSNRQGCLAAVSKQTCSEAVGAASQMRVDSVIRRSVVKDDRQQQMQTKITKFFS
eukprot:GHVS01059012.1.p1 GENE.GHVS01059012.1~~GHVS01059012.1.p1  ORF type:complete len:814 (+),score=175.83 GHVS01059012.1:509-2950(+)